MPLMLRTPARWLRWLTPGLYVKRWLLLLMFSILMVDLGIAYFLKDIYAETRITGSPGVLAYYGTLQFLPRPVRAFLFGGLGVGLLVFSFYMLQRSILGPFIPGGDRSVAELLYSSRVRSRGPRIVSIGGGHGLSTLLRGLKEFTGNLHAIVTVADDGGSSGVLRRELGVLPPGDVRNCIAALADAEPLVTKLFQYRFEDGAGLAGHSFGNLFIVAMSGVTGNMEDAIRQTSRVLAVRGQIIPSTMEDVTLCAHIDDKRTIQGESSIAPA